MTFNTNNQRLDRSQIRANLDSFKHLWLKRLDSWKAQGQGALEKKYAQSFWAEMFECFGIKATRMDLFEQDARRGTSGNTGYIDLFWPGMVIGEAKSPGVDLEDALRQARDYLQGGSVSETEQPRYILCSNFENLRLVHLAAPEQRFDITFPLADITDHLDQLKFLAGYSDTTYEEQEEASLRASKLMADLFTAMVGDDVDENVGESAPINPEDEDTAVQETSMYLTRLLFLLFGDDAGLWEQDLFYRFVLEHTNSENLGSQLAALFSVLNTPEDKRRRVPEILAKFPYVNGSIFAESMPMQYFNPEMRDALLNACRFQWADISPAIFGSLFQLVKSKKARRSDGEHYTSEKNILKTIEPLFLDDLREEARGLISRKSTSIKKLRDFRDSLANHLFIDPACGSGNFLIVAYRELRKIETDLIVAIRERSGQSSNIALDISWEQRLSIGQFYGIELNWWPARIAETAMFLVDHQANRELADRVGMAPERLPISVTAHITHANALEEDWEVLIPKVKGKTFIFGNPPFAGHKERSKEQGELLKKVWGTSKIGHLDFVTAWFVLAMELLSDREGEFAFVATNSIAQGEAVAPIFDKSTKGGWAIKFAHKSFVWDSEAPGKAAVHCVIVGYTKSRNFEAKLYSPDCNVPECPESISPYLIPGPPIVAVRPVKKRPLSPSLSPIRAGSTPIDWDNLVVTESEYEEVVADPIAKKYLRLYIGGDELINGNRRWCLWLADSDSVAEDVKRSPILKKRIESVAENRSKSERGKTKELASTPHLFGENRQPNVDYLALPQSFTERRKYATSSRVSASVIASVKLFTVEDFDGFLFALISSSMFITWQKTVGGRIKSDPSVSSSLVWNTFPVPEVDPETRKKIVALGKRIEEVRGLHPDRTLARHYDPLAMDPTLVKAHDSLDRAVDKIFGAQRKLTTERQRQDLLFANYLRLIHDNA